MSASIEHLFCERLLRIYLRQIALLDELPSTVYVFHRDSATLAFSDGTVLETQVLGVESPDGTWRWAWDDAVVPHGCAASARQVRTHGEALGLPELTTGRLDVTTLACRGHTLAAAATELLGAEHPYMRCEQPDGMAVYLIPPLRTARDPRAMTRSEARQAILDMFAAFAQRDDMLTLRSALEAAGFAVTSTETEIVGRRGDDEPLVFQRAWFA